MTIAMSVKKSLSNEVEISCSQFMRFFLVQDAKLLGRKFNGHVNEIVKLYLRGEFAMNDEPQTEWDLQANSSSWCVRINLHQTTREKLKNRDALSIRGLIERAIHAYIAFGLKKSERSQILCGVAKQCRMEIARIDKRLSVFDEEDETLQNEVLA